MARLPPLPFLAKTQLNVFLWKVKINRRLVETLRNFGDTLYVLFEMSIKKPSGNYFPKARLPRLPFLAKTQLHAYRRKFKINRRLVEEL